MFLPGTFGLLGFCVWPSGKWEGVLERNSFRIECGGTARTSTPMRRSGGWTREEATGNLCLGSRAAVQERVGKFLAGLTTRRDEVRRRCRTVLQSRAEALLRDSRHDSSPQANAHPTLALV